MAEEFKEDNYAEIFQPAEMETKWKKSENNQKVIDNIFRKFKIKQGIYENIKEKVVPEESAIDARNRVRGGKLDLKQINQLKALHPEL